MSWMLTPAEYDLTLAKIAKINDRAVAKGFTGRLEVVGTVVETTRTTEIGLPVTEVFYATTVSGEPPSYGGWTVLAALDWTEAGLIVRTAPGVESIDRSGLVEGACAHCRTDRRRVKCYVVSDGAQTVQVGSTCLKDFIGWHGSVSLLFPADVSELIDGMCGGVVGAYATETVLAAAWAVIREYGYVRSGDRGATRDAVLAVLDPASRADREFAARLRPLVAEAVAMAATVRAFIGSDAFAGTSEYVTNMKILCAADWVEPRHFGFVVSAPQAMARAQERDLIRRRTETDAATVLDEWYGAEKDRVRINVKIESFRWIANDWGSTALYRLVSDTGHLFVWYATRATLGETATTEHRRLTGTVKQHNTYKGQKQTVLTRCAWAKEPTGTPRSLEKTG